LSSYSTASAPLAISFMETRKKCVFLIVLKIINKNNVFNPF